MNYPLINLVIATFNSESTLEKLLQSIKTQDYPKNKIRIHIIDGGSTDKTTTIAKRYQCKIMRNLKVEDIFAKHLGFLRVTGKYILYLDSDEMLENRHSLKIKYRAFKKDARIKAVIPSGYRTPIKFSSINFYINEFGDPLSFFIYKQSKGDSFAMKDWIYKYNKVYEDVDTVMFNFFKTKQLPLIELCAGGCMIDLNFAKKEFPEIKKDPALITHLFYLFQSKNTLLAVTKNDYTIHYSSQNYYKYLKKIASRVKNNVYKTTRGRGGVLGRERFQSLWFRLKKFFFIPYSLSIIFPLYDSIYLSITRKRLVYLTHIFLCLYTTVLIIYYYSLKFLNIKLEIKSYGN